jgi:ribosomal protein S12 methylthiotransferase accessory factor
MALANDSLEDSFRLLEQLRSSVLARDKEAAVSRLPLRRLSRLELEPVLGDIGITRVGRLTELDDIGIPVWAAMRPASRSLSVSAGKGTTDEAAWTSAVMESCEQAMAEEVGALVCLVESQRGLANRGLHGIGLNKQSRCAASHLDPNKELAWVKGLSWRTGETIYAPYELVGLDMLASAPWDTDTFRMTSLGLASGAELESAIVHGLQELVEDDAMFAALLPRVGTRTTAVSFDEGRSARLLDTIEKLAAAGVEASFAELKSDCSMSVVAVALVPHGGPFRDRAYFSGIACNAVAENAALDALLEAVQCRAIFVSGARDDLYQADYRLRLTDATRALFAHCSFKVPEADVAEHDASLGSIAESVLGMTGGDFFVFPLGGAQHGFEAVRVLADDLVSMDVPDAYARKGRAAMKLLDKWSRP